MHQRLLAGLLRTSLNSNLFRNSSRPLSYTILNGSSTKSLTSAAACRSYWSGHLTCVQFQFSPVNCRGFCSSADDPSYEILYNDFKNMSQDGKHVIIDVREPKERIDPGIISGTHSIPLGQIAEAFDMDAEKFERMYKFKKPSTEDANVVLHCLGGVRSRKALNAVHQLGYNKVRHYIGGIEDWLERGDMLTTDKPTRN